MIPYFGWAELTESTRLFSTPQGYTIVDPLAYSTQNSNFCGLSWSGIYILWNIYQDGTHLHDKNL
jgi:hypothetical protein